MRIEKFIFFSLLSKMMFFLKKQTYQENFLNIFKNFNEFVLNLTST